MQLDEYIKDIQQAFDEAYYLAMNSDVDFTFESGVAHYCRIGWKEGRNPSKQFSTSGYLALNADVAEAQVNPFWHYIVVGRNEGRASELVGGAAAQILFRGETLPQKKMKWRGAGASVGLISSERLFSTVAFAVARDKSKKLLLSISHDDYTTISGGVQLCMLREQIAAKSAGNLLLHLRPVEALPALADTNPSQLVLAASLNGDFIGYCVGQDLVAAISRVRRLFATAQVVIHHLMGHSPELVGEIIAAADAAACWFWLHDFFSLCTSYSLQRNDVAFCAAPPATSLACQVCLYGRERGEQLNRLHKLFTLVRMKVVSPSQFALNFWMERTSLPYSEVYVHPHATLTWDEEGAPVSEHIDSVRIAFVGTPAYHKGWDTFLSLAAELSSLQTVKFFAFSNSSPKSNLYTNVSVSVTLADPLAMVEALRENRIDFVIHWANWAETFSYSTYESLCSGSQVITNEISGNVQVIVKETHLGKVFSDVEEVVAYLKSEDCIDDSKKNRNRRSKLQPIYKFHTMDYFRSSLEQ